MGLLLGNKKDVDRSTPRSRIFHNHDTSLWGYLATPKERGATTINSATVLRDVRSE